MRLMLPLIPYVGQLTEQMDSSNEAETTINWLKT